LNDHFSIVGSTLLAQLNASNPHASNDDYDDYKIYIDNSVQNSVCVYSADILEIMPIINS
jgi:hypothetical protein